MKEPLPEFTIAKKMPMGTRFTWIAGLAIFGFVLQIFASMLFGWLFVLAAALMGIVRGRSNEPKTIGTPEWQNTTVEELEQAAKLLEDAQTLSRQAGVFSAGTFGGCAFGCLAVAAVGFVTIMLIGLADAGLSNGITLEPVVRGGSLGLLFAIDAITLLAPMWLFGRVSAWEPPYMGLRLDQIAYIYDHLKADPTLEFQPSLQVAKTSDGSVPLDCKLMVKPRDANPDFMGIQVQTSLNDVQGKKYPYTYCVLIAKPAFELKRKVKEIAEPPPVGPGFLGGIFQDDNARRESVFHRLGDALVELDTEKDVEIAVVRQDTSNGGYKTSPEQAMEVFMAAYRLAKGVLGS